MNKSDELFGGGGKCESGTTNETLQIQNKQVDNSSQLSLNTEMSRLTRDGTAGPVSRDQILRRERGQGNIHFPFLADHGQDWKLEPVDPYSC